MKTITLLNEKGGVGKTTLATHLAAGLAIRGYTVIFVDADPQANATSTFQLPKSGTLYDMMVRERSWRDSLQIVHPDVYGEPGKAPAGRLLAVPGNVETRNIAMTINDGTIIKRRLDEITTVADYVIIDTSPTPSLLHASIMLATDHVIIPTQCESISALEGVPDSIQHTQAVRSQAAMRGLSIADLLAIIPNMYRVRTIAHNEVLQYLRDNYGDKVWPPLPQSIIFAEARMLNQMLYGYAPDAKITRYLWQIVKRVEELTKVTA